MRTACNTNDMQQSVLVVNDVYFLLNDLYLIYTKNILKWISFQERLLP